MNKLTLPKPLQPKHLRVRLKRRRIHLWVLKPRHTYQVSSHILRQVLVQRVKIVLQVLRRFSKPERVEPPVPNHGPV